MKCLKSIAAVLLSAIMLMTFLPDVAYASTIYRASDLSPEEALKVDGDLELILDADLEIPLINASGNISIKSEEGTHHTLTMKSDDPRIYADGAISVENCSLIVYNYMKAPSFYDYALDSVDNLTIKNTDLEMKGVASGLLSHDGNIELDNVSGTIDTKVLDGIRSMKDIYITDCDLTISYKPYSAPINRFGIYAERNISIESSDICINDYYTPVIVWYASAYGVAIGSLNLSDDIYIKYPEGGKVYTVENTTDEEEECYSHVIWDGDEPNVTISKKRLSDDICTVEGDFSDRNFTGQAYTPQVSVYWDGTALTESKDYTVSYSDNVDPGIASVTITGMGIYSGSRVVSFNIVSAEDDTDQGDQGENSGGSDTTDQDSNNSGTENGESASGSDSSGNTGDNAEDADPDGKTPSALTEIARTAVSEAVSAARNVEKGNYTDESYKALQDAIAEAEALAGDNKATAEQLKAAADKVTAAKAALREKEVPAPATPAEQAVKTVKAGDTVKYQKNKYKVISVRSKTVAFSKSKNAKSVTVPAKIRINGKTFKVTQINAKAFTGKKIRTVTVGKNVRAIKKNAFRGSKATKLILKTRLLKKTKIKGCLKNSKIKNVQVKVSTKKSVNKKYVKTYKKIFTKANAGKKVKIK